MPDSSFLPPPQHIAIIMDGNGRWAQSRHLPRVAGHRAGADNVLKIADTAWALGVKYLTLYTFSTENWKRSVEEVSALMQLFAEFLDSQLPEIQRRNIRLRVIGQMERLPFFVRNKLKKVIQETQNNTAGTLIFALSYGGRQELTDAMVQIAKSVVQKKLKPSQITTETIQSHLYAPDIPDPELMIRTSGELRISNFLLWQLAYAEFYITDLLWPDFSPDDLKMAINAYTHRERRFGGRNPQNDENEKTIYDT